LGGTYAVIIPAYNEADYLLRTLEAVEAAMHALKTKFSGRLIVVDNNSTDDTAQLAKDFGAEVVFEAHNQIARARNTGGEASKGEDFLIFLDADTLLAEAHLLEILELLQSGKYSGGGVLIDFDGPVPSLARFLHASWNKLTVFRKWTAGACIFCRREAFEELGGFNEGVYAGEDVLFGHALKKWGRAHKMKTAITKHAVLTSARKFEWFTNGQIIWRLLSLVFRPWILHTGKGLDFWYERPANDSKEELVQTKK
jgi:glycosyltransferase involved in cell wall biosynthesis